MTGKNILLIDAAVAVPVFALAYYLGANLPISLVFAGLAANLVNVMGAMGLFRS